MSLDFDTFDSLAKQVAFKYSGYGGAETDDLYQLAWLKITEMRNDSEDDDINFYYLRTSVFNYIKSYLKLVKRVNLYSVPTSDTDLMLLPDIDEKVDEEDKVIDKGKEDKHWLKEILELYEKDSKEELLVKAFAQALNIENYFKDFPRVYTVHEMNRKISVWLGYASSMSSGYRGLLGRVRRTLREYGYR